MKQILFAWWVLVAGCFSGFAADTATKTERLEKLKKEFPAHVAGANLEKAHPVVRQCYEEVKRRADALSEDRLAHQMIELAQHVDWAVGYNEGGARAADNAFGAAGRTAAKRNAYWLKERVKPWLRRVANVAQGKS